jgi:CubicO group peptidase (beta-lactamase class C family)
MLRKLSVALVCIASLSSAHAQTRIQTPAKDPAARMQQVIQSYVDNKSFMGTVLVVKDGKTLIDEGYGSADLEWKIPNTPAVRFRLGSVTKQFTAAGILLLEERGKLRIDDPIGKYLPDAPEAWQKVTIYNVLTHTSGIPSFTGFPDYHSTEWKDTNPAELVARFRDKPLDFEPGSKFNYSNSGYVLLGYLLEKVSGQTYADFLQQNIFTPLEMSSTGIDSNAAILPQRAQGYQPSPHGIEHAGYISMTIPFSAGALYSTTGDLLKWEQGLFGGKVLKPESLAKMITPFKENYGCGVFVRTIDGHKLINHGGGIEGFNTSLGYYPDDKLTVIVLGNLNGGAPDQIANSLGKVALGQPVILTSERKAITVSPTILADYVGTYQLTPNLNNVVTLKDGHLISKLGNQPEVELFPESETSFFLKVVDAQAEFVRDPTTHAVTHMTIHQNGNTRDAKKQ